jgi:hypothetical protein
VFSAHMQYPEGLADYELPMILSDGGSNDPVGKWRKRRCDLSNAGLIEDSGQKKKSPDGYPVIVWRMAQLGLAVKAGFVKLEDCMAKGTRRRKGEMHVEVFHKMGEPSTGEVIDETGGDVPISDTPWNETVEAWNSGSSEKSNISWLVLSPTHLPDALPDEALNELPVEVLADLQEQMTEQQNLLDRAGERMVELIARKYGERLALERDRALADTGTFRIEDGQYEIKQEIRKKVEWDQTFLAALREKIIAAGDDPSQYIKVTYGVGERDYQGWGDNIKNTFLPGRTVKPQKPSYTIEIKL